MSPLIGSNVVTVDQFQPAVLECMAVGIPPPQIKWSRSRGNLNESLTNSSVYIIYSTVGEMGYQLPNNRGHVFSVTSTLTVTEAQLEDSTRYFCNAISSPGSSTQNIELNVHGKCPAIVFLFLSRESCILSKIN